MPIGTDESIRDIHERNVCVWLITARDGLSRNPGVQGAALAIFLGKGTR